jgi:hypothetical protein
MLASICLAVPLRATLRLPEEWNAGDAVELFSAAGTFVAAVAGFLSISVIVLEQTVPDGLTVLVGPVGPLVLRFKLLPPRSPAAMPKLMADCEALYISVFLARTNIV